MWEFIHSFLTNRNQELSTSLFCKAQHVLGEELNRFSALQMRKRMAVSKGIMDFPITFCYNPVKLSGNK